MYRGSASLKMPKGRRFKFLVQLSFSPGKFEVVGFQKSVMQFCKKKTEGPSQWPIVMDDSIKYIWPHLAAVPNAFTAGGWMDAKIKHSLFSESAEGLPRPCLEDLCQACIKEKENTISTNLGPSPLTDKEGEVLAQTESVEN
ncbi:hypothetical protein N7520_000104 [Penicillium odoratum]|uniref:uncharacterized protein n=1 Tax=Penicillium odoratum TaxID=1167516 RepID=UPI0025494D6C|nr:uncharacterized protein N7520_000104 [Penicillium odoratum]KAJ5776858.1 hypothetical protein N7520_000104 [Penicillium odoratum]